MSACNSASILLPPFGFYSFGCPECGATDDLVSCDCGAVSYCGVPHKRLHQKRHNKCCCLKIVQARKKYEAAKKFLPPHQAEVLQSINVLEIVPAYLAEGEISAFEKCLEERRALAWALRAPRTRQALEESTEHLRWNTILRPDSPAITAPRVVASYLIRANRDDECHDFIRQYTLVIFKCREWLTDEQMVIERSRDPFNDLDLFHSPFAPNEVLLFVALIKLRMLAELKELGKINDAVVQSIGNRLPLELVDYVRSSLHDNPILANMCNAGRSNYKERIKNLQTQIDRLWWEVRHRCKYLWPYLLDNRVLLRPECGRHSHRMGRTGCALCNLKDMSKIHIEDAWKQSPGALEYIAQMVLKHDPGCLVGDDDFLNLRPVL